MIIDSTWLTPLLFMLRISASSVKVFRLIFGIHLAMMILSDFCLFLRISGCNQGRLLAMAQCFPLLRTKCHAVRAGWASVKNTSHYVERRVLRSSKLLLHSMKVSCAPRKMSWTNGFWLTRNHSWNSFMKKWMVGQLHYFFIMWTIFTCCL